jgi:hypothetical protein
MARHYIRCKLYAHGNSDHFPVELGDYVWYVFACRTLRKNHQDLSSMTDIIYACQDKIDDLKVGVRSTAILFGTYIRPLLAGFGILFVSALAYAGYLNSQGAGFYVVSLGGTALHLVWQYRTVDLDNPASCKREHDAFDPEPELIIDVSLQSTSFATVNWDGSCGLALSSTI